MKKKHSEPTVKRQRRTNLELVGLSREHLRTIKRISEMSQVPISRVGTDVIEIGIASVLSMYKPMIEMEDGRKARSERMKRIFDEQADSEPVRPGSPDEQADVGEVKLGSGTEDEVSANGVTLDFSGATLVRPGDADEQPGYEPEVDPTVGSVSPDGEIIIER